MGPCSSECPRCPPCWQTHSARFRGTGMRPARIHHGFHGRTSHTETLVARGVRSTPTSAQRTTNLIMGHELPHLLHPDPCTALDLQPPAASPRLEMSRGPFPLLSQLLVGRLPLPPFVCPGTRTCCLFTAWGGWGAAEAHIQPEVGKEH